MTALILKPMKCVSGLPCTLWAAKCLKPCSTQTAAVIQARAFPATIPSSSGYEFTEYRKKEALTVLGVVQVNRAYYYDRQCGSGICPKDKALDIEGTSFSPGVRRIWIWNIADECFPGAVQIIDLYHAREHYWKAGRAVPCSTG
ncbi:MAG: hypothetical protein DDT31_01576 [Syntrophomonadaceae bacterium]|nr:hypothetical protein [Bacillota bacterium]